MKLRAEGVQCHVLRKRRAAGNGGTCLLIPALTAIGKQISEFQDSQGYPEKPKLKNKNKQKKKDRQTDRKKDRQTHSDRKEGRKGERERKPSFAIRGINR